MIGRRAEQQIEQLAKSFRVVAVTGPRQSGKTTLLKAMFGDYQYFNLEDLTTLDLISADPMGFVRGHSKVIIDEVQRMPELLSAIQVAADERDQTGDFVISGSQNLLLSEKISQSLAGRAAYQTLMPLTIGELKESAKLAKTNFQQIYQGFYPALYNNPVEPRVYYDQYVATYVERDLRSLKNIQDLSVFRKFMGLLAGRIGQLVNYEALANDTGIAVKTVKQWLSILEASYLIFRLPPYYANLGKRLVKSSKIYFTDTGLACYLLGINNAEALENFYLLGGLFENMCVMDIRKQILNEQGLKNNLYFYRDNNGNEVDLVIDLGSGKLMPLEIKSAGRFNSDFLSGMISMRSAFANHQETDILNGAVIYAGETQSVVGGTNVVNWREIAEII
jgi:predicted AAA+ superfamily ATPase